MFQTRRDFLKSSSLIAWSLTVPGFVARTSQAASSGKETILVIVELTGGNDGLNTVVPFKDPDYAKYRPTLKLPTNQLKKVNDEIGLHPSMTGMADLLQEQALCIVQGVGYPNPNQSHFTSMDIWQSARLPEAQHTEGWLGRALKQVPSAPAFHLATNNQTAPLALTGAPVRAPSITSLDDFQLKTAAASGTDQKEQRAIIEGAAQGGSGKPNLLDFVQRTAANTYASSKRLQEIARNYQPKVPYPPSGLANRLRLAAQLIDADLGARLFYVSIDGFDTHSAQAGPHANLWTEVSSALTAFYRDLAARGHKDRLLIMTFSEFGRRAKENGSRGTDHGSAAPLFLIGGKVKPGLIGAHPSLANLEMGNLKHHTDFRQVYAAVLDQWLQVKSADVLGEAFKPVEVLKS